MNKSIIVKGKENDVVFRLFENDNSIDEIHIQIEGEKSWTVIGYKDLKIAIEEAEKEFNIEKRDGIELIAKERQRQIEIEGFTKEHDKQHCDDELAIAAACYTIPESIRINELKNTQSIYAIPRLFPWGKEWWKPSPDERITELVKAGALIAAQIDQVQDVS